MGYGVVSSVFIAMMKVYCKVSVGMLVLAENILPSMSTLHSATTSWTTMMSPRSKVVHFLNIDTSFFKYLSRYDVIYDFCNHVYLF